jgi:hypothetical protein
METEIRLQYKRDTGTNPEVVKSLYCEDCGSILYPEDLFTLNYVEYLENKLINYENSERNRKGNP